MPKKLLEGIKVADFTWVYTGPLSTKPLADYGAEVIKVEGRNRPDICRFAHPYMDEIEGVNRAGDYNHYNTSKLSLCLNLALPKGKEIAKRLVAWADIVVDNYAGGAMDRMGLGYEELKKIKPSIIMLSSSIQGQMGPHANYRAMGQQLTALSGFTHITRWPDREPVWIGPYTDFIAPHYNTLAILAALDYRRRTGEGQYIDTSQFETAQHFLAPLILDYVVNQRISDAMGNRSPCAAPHGAYCCRGDDRWCAIAVFTDEEWKSFGKVIGNPAWTNESRFATLLARKEGEDELDKLIEAWTINHPAEEVMTMMQMGGVAAGVLETGEDQMEHDSQLRHRNYFQEVDHPEIGKYRAPSPPFLFSKSVRELRRAPLLGEHNEYICREILGISDEEIAELVIEGVLE